jgi:hypothetical protein
MDGDTFFGYKNGCSVAYYKSKVYNVACSTKYKSHLVSFAKKYTGAVYDGGNRYYYFVDKKSGQILKIYYEPYTGRYQLILMPYSSEFDYYVKKGVNVKIHLSKVKF